MTETKSDRLEKSVQYLSWPYLVGSVFRVFQENIRHYAAHESAIKPSSDAWCINDRLRRDIYDRACKHYCALSGADHTYFPLSVDGVARIYFRIRKRSREETAGFEEELSRALAQLGCSIPGTLPFMEDE